MSTLIEVKVPDIGDFKDIPVVELLVKVGDTVNAEDPLVMLESDKATVEVPSPAAGRIAKLSVKVGDKVSKDSLLLMLEADAPAANSAQVASKEQKQPAPSAAAPVPPAPRTAPPAPAPAVVAQPQAVQPVSVVSAQPAPLVEGNAPAVHASPSVRHVARELGVDLSRVNGSGPKNRVLREDVQAYVKSMLARGAGSGSMPGFSFPPLPQVDFSKFGPIEYQPLSRIKKLAGGHLHRNWVSIPHVTQHGEADITELESFRKAQAEAAQKQGPRLTLVAFLIKAVAATLKQYPNFNATLAADGEQLILKHYFNIGVAVDTPPGLVVPVLREVDKKGLLDLAKELGETSARMREGKISTTDLQGGCFSISSLGGIGGTFFTPIINAPEVAILGVGRAALKPVWNGKKFVPRLMLPLSLSYDHRVIDGAQGARFISFLADALADVRQLAL